MLYMHILSRVALVMLAFLFILPMITCVRSKTISPFDALYEAGVDAALKGDYINGAQSLLQAIQMLPTHFEARQLLGSCYAAMGNFPDAAAHLAEAYRMNKHGGQFLVSNYIEALRRNGELKKSISIGLSFLEEKPNDAEVLINTGVALQEAKEEKKSLDLFIRCINAEPTKLSCWERSINVLLEMGEMVDAERMAEDAVKQFPAIANIHCLLGLSKHYQSKFPEALELYLQCLELNPQHDMVWTNIGAVHQSLGNVEEALNAYDRALAQLHTQNIPLNKGHAGLLNNYGSLMTIIGREAEGVEFLQRALELDPDMENVNVNLGSHFQDEGDLVTAEHHFREAIRITRQFAMTSAVRDTLTIYSMEKE
jgi:tetratricopeptide (TPR) repeat protein